MVSQKTTDDRETDRRKLLAGYLYDCSKMIALRAYHVSGSEGKFRGKSGNEQKNTPAVKKSSRWGNKWRPL